MADVHEGGVSPVEGMEELQNTIISLGVGHVLDSDEAVRREFVENFKRALFPVLGTSLDHTVWKTYRNITRVTPLGRDHFLNNVRLFMVKEALGLGPDYYCVVRYAMGAYADHLFLLTAFLPADKVCFDTRFGLAPRGPFERFERACRVGAEISARRIPLADMP